MDDWIPGWIRVGGRTRAGGHVIDLNSSLTKDRPCRWAVSRLSAPNGRPVSRPEAWSGPQVYSRTPNFPHVRTPFF